MIAVANLMPLSLGILRVTWPEVVEPALRVSGAVGLAPCRPLVAVGAYQIVGLLLEKGVQGVLDCSSDELP